MQRRANEESKDSRPQLIDATLHRTLFDGVEPRGDLNFPAPHRAGDSLISVSDAAGVLASSERTVLRLIENGTLPCVHVASGVRIRRSALDAYVDSRTTRIGTREALKVLAKREVRRARQRKAERGTIGRRN